MTDNDFYWAAAPDDEIGDMVAERIDRFHEQTRSDGTLRLITNAWSKYFSALETLGSIQLAGQQGEQLEIRVPHVRNVGQVLTNMVTQQRVSFQPRALSTDSESQAQAILARGILEYDVRSKHLDSLSREVVDTTVALGEAAIVVEWDPYGGPETAIDPVSGERAHSGEVRLEPLGPLDLVRDWTRSTSRGHQWLIARRWRNRWDLVATHPDLRDEILGVETYDPTSVTEPVLGWSGGQTMLHRDGDLVPVYELYHKRCPALPDGRLTRVLRDGTVLDDGELGLPFIPIFRMQGAPVFGRPIGYTNIFDCLSVQEGVNALYSAAATNNTLAVQNIAIKKGDVPGVKSVRGGMNIVEYTDTPPVPLQLVQTAPETYRFIQVLEHNIELLSGVNSVARGAPEASLKSGRALALIQSQAIEFSQALQQSYIEMLEGVAGAIIELYKRNATEPQIALIAGKGMRSYAREFKGSDLDRIDRVAVELANPVASSVAGRVQMADNLLQYGLLKDPAQYMMVLQTGNVDILTEGTTSELLNIKSENERLSRGEPVLVLELDNHRTHIMEHSSIIASPEAREDPTINEAVQMHITEHIRLWSQADPNLLMALGLPPLAPPPPPEGAPPVPVGPQPQPGDLTFGLEIPEEEIPQTPGGMVSPMA